MGHGEEEKAKGSDTAVARVCNHLAPILFCIFFPREIREPTDSPCDNIITSSQSRCWNAWPELGWDFIFFSVKVDS